MSLVIEQPPVNPEEKREPITIEGLQRNLYITLAVLVVVALASVVYFYDTLFSPKEAALTPEEVFQRLLVAGDFDGALALLPPGGTGEPAEQFARFMSAIPEEQLKAAQSAEESFRKAAGDPVAQVSHLNTVIEQLLVSRDRDLYDYFFREGSPFTSYKKNTIDASAVALAEYGMTLHPTSVAQVVLVLPHITAINQAASIDDSVRKHIESGEQKIAAAVALNTEEMKRMSAVDAYRAELRMLTWKSSFFGAAALKDAKYLPDLEANAQRAIDLYDGLVAKNGRDNYLQPRIPPILVTYAGVLVRLGETHNARIDAVLKKLIEFVEAQPQMHEAVFIATVKRLAAQAGDERGYQYNTYRLLAEKSQAFNALVAKYGLTF